MPSLPSTLLTTRQIVFPVLILLSYLISVGPIEKIIYIFKDEAWRIAVDEESLRDMPSGNFTDAEGLSANRRALRAAASSLAHFIPALLWIVIWPLQFSNRLRIKYPALHRYLGTFGFMVAVSLILSAPLMCINGGCFSNTRSRAFPFELSFSAPFLFFVWPYAVVACIQSYRHAVARRFKLHRQWVLRLSALFQGIVLVRPLLAVHVFILLADDPRTTDPQFSFDKFWMANGICMVGSIFIIEIWIQLEKKYKLDTVPMRLPKAKLQ